MIRCVNYNYFANQSKTREYLQILGYEILTINKFLRELMSEEKYHEYLKEEKWSVYILRRKICWKNQEEYNRIKYLLLVKKTIGEVYRDFGIEITLAYILKDKLESWFNGKIKVKWTEPNKLFIVIHQKTINTILERLGYRVKTLRKHLRSLMLPQEIKDESKYTVHSLNKTYAVKLNGEDEDNFREVIEGTGTYRYYLWEYDAVYIFIDMILTALEKEITGKKI